jgi:UDP-N-acetylglucosamine--N-acetylmuramyl-(pentapeptide) pyrophosphoryl-undecaprenol N-acetylglucosamine transferase
VLIVFVGLTAGGGGHTGYAIAIAQRLMGKARVFFVVSSGDLWSLKRVLRYGSVLEVPRLRDPDKPLPIIFTLHRFIKAYFKTLRSLPRDLDVLISTGSNLAIAPALAAKTLRKPIINLECGDRLATPTKTAKLLYRVSNITIVQWEEQLKMYPKALVVGPIYEKPEYKPYSGGYILVTMGTYGFKEFFDNLVKLNYERVVVQTGRVDPEQYRRVKPNWVFFDFDPDIGKWIAGADVVITHTGITALNAALAYRKSVVIVRNPRWVLAARREDAALLAEKLNAVFLEDITTESIERAVREAERRKPPQYPDGAEKLTKILEEITKKSK